MIRSFLILLCFVFGLASPAVALDVAARASVAELPNALGAAHVVRVVDGDTVILSDKREVRLVGIQAPKLPLGRKNFQTWPKADEAKRALEQLVLGRTVNLRAGGAEKDRHGRVLAHLLRDDDLWIQGEMLRLGLARVYSFPDNRAGVKALLVYEAQARAAKRGIWSDPYYAVQTAQTVKKRIGGYELVEGAVFKVTKVKARTYLNFEQDYRTDFTIILNAAARRALVRAKMTPEDLEGAKIRVRGWVNLENGPMIAVSHPEQIEILKPSKMVRASESRSP